MFELKIENANGQELTLTQNESNYQVYQIDGLNPPMAQINTSKVAGMDGSKFNSSKLQERNVVIYIKLHGDIEANRLKLYSYFPTSQYCKIYYKNGSRNVFVEGYVETNEVTPFTNNERMQVSIICPYPYFKDLNEIVTDISKVIKKFIFPFSINIDYPIPFSTIELNQVTNVINNSESETGLIINVNFNDDVSKLEIRNTDTGENMILNYNFLEDDYLLIDCNKGSKRITLTREGAEYNLIPYLQRGSTFFQVRAGDNKFTYLADDGSSDQLVLVRFRHYNVYRGV